MEIIVKECSHSDPGKSNPTRRRLVDSDDRDFAGTMEVKTKTIGRETQKGKPTIDKTYRSTMSLFSVCVVQIWQIKLSTLVIVVCRCWAAHQDASVTTVAGARRGRIFYYNLRINWLHLAARRPVQCNKIVLFLELCPCLASIVPWFTWIVISCVC